jgi:serine/threonine protein kinase
MIMNLLSGDPSMVGPYRLLARLGQGGMGVVYLARSPGGRQVAVKVIRPELAGEPGFRTRFAREVAAARNVSGMFTALVVDADTLSPLPWLATAYVPGQSLAEAVETEGLLPTQTVLQLAAGLAEGLQAIHSAGVVHRDLKPSNVLLAPDGPRVIDFGISKATETSMLTQTGTVMGTPGYLSPEVCSPTPRPARRPSAPGRRPRCCTGSSTGTRICRRYPTYSGR